MDSLDAPSRIDKGPSSGYAHPNWSNYHFHQPDVADGRDVHRDTDVRGGRERGYNGPRTANKGGQGRRQRGYKQLFQKVMRGERDTLDTDGRMPSEMSVEELVKVCSSLPASASAVTAVAPSLAYLDSRATAALMKELAKCQQLSRAMEIFDWLKSLPTDHELYSLCDVYTFTTAISLMGPSQQLRRALEYIGEMRARGLQCNVHTYSALMNVCIKCDACDLALDVFKQMHEDKIRPNVVTYNTLVDVYGKTGQWEKAVQVLDDMRLEDLEPEVRTFNTAIIACNMCGQPQEALKVYQKLLETGLQPISTTYTALISAYGKAGQLEQALDTFQTMIQQGCERSVITYSALISACEKAGRWELALQLFDQMQKEGCAPNTVTYNSLITACQQGGQPDKACKVFEQMKYHGCRPDVVTYTALINAHNKAGQWRKALQAFEQMQQQNCKPDSFVYQTVIDSLWQTGVSWAHNRAWQLYASAARNWQYRFTVQLASSNNSRDLEYVVPAFSPGVAVLALRKWLADLVSQVESDSTLLGLTRERIVLSLGRGRQAKEPANNAACQALTAVLKGFRSPFRAGDGSITAAGNVVIAEASMPAALEWLCTPELPEFLTLLVPPNAASSRQPSPLGGTQKRISFASDLAEDAKLDDSCQRAYNTVVDFEMAQLLQPASISGDYLAEREGCINAAFKLADQFDLAEEVVFDAVLLMDRVMSTGAQHDSSLSLLFVVAALRIAALQTVPTSDQAAMDSLPSDAVLSTATGFPEGSVSKMEQNITGALSGDTKCISMLRSLKLFLERMGAEQQDVPAAQHLCRGTVRLLKSALIHPTLLSSRPSVVAAAVLVSARRAVGCHPFFPACLEQLTGMRGETASCTELATAVAAVEPLIPAAGLEPPPRITPHMLVAANRPVSAGRLFSHLAPGLNGAGSGYSTPSHASTPTAAGVNNVPFIPNKTLLDAVVRQHSMQRAASDMSSVSTHSEGSAGDLQALLSSTAAAAAVASGNLSGSPVPPGLGGSALLHPPEPGLAAAMAGLQLGMNVNMNLPGMHGVPGLAGIGPGFMPQMQGYNPWLAAMGHGAFNAGGAADPYQLAAMQHQQQQASRLAQMTNPYTMPMTQHAMMLNNAANLLQ